MEENLKQDYPLIPEAVIIYLEKVFPNKYPTDELTQYQFGKGAGNQEVIQHLKQVKQWSEEQNVQN
jgi:hypothetical protein